MARGPTLELGLGDAFGDQIAEILIDGQEQTSERPQEATEEEFRYPHLLRPEGQATAVSQAAIVFLDMAMLLSLFSLVAYLSRGGLAEIQGWFAMQVGR